MSKQGLNSELFGHENNALTARPQLHTKLRIIGTSLSQLWTNFFISERKIETNNKAKSVRTGMTHLRIFEIPVFNGKF